MFSLTTENEHMTQNDTAPHLEAALQRTETDADASLKAVAAVTKSLKRFVRSFTMAISER
jgi:hypothetical protein